MVWEGPAVNHRGGEGYERGGTGIGEPCNAFTLPLLSSALLFLILPQVRRVRRPTNMRNLWRETKNERNHLPSFLSSSTSPPPGFGRVYDGDGDGDARLKYRTVPQLCLFPLPSSMLRSRLYNYRSRSSIYIYTQPYSSNGRRKEVCGLIPRYFQTVQYHVRCPQEISLAKKKRKGQGPATSRCSLELGVLASLYLFLLQIPFFITRSKDVGDLCCLSRRAFFFTTFKKNSND